MAMIDIFLNRLKKVKKRGAGRWVACCPCHDDSTPSLSIKDDSGMVVMHCFGCGANGLDVCAKLGIDPSDLFPADSKTWIRDDANRRVAHNPADILYCLQLDCAKVSLIAREMAKHEMISGRLKKELDTIAYRIMTASTYSDNDNSGGGV